MTRRWGLILVAVNLTVLVALAFVYPHLMVSPGALVAAHKDLTTDCFACHTPLLGASSSRCVACHALANIGLRTTAGAPLPKPATKVSFHQELMEQDCMGCHSDHQGPKPALLAGRSFSHALLRPAIREQCESCHAPPPNELHHDLTVGCGQCHTGDGWKPASFEHARLAPAVRERCESCHKAPVDTLHGQFSGNCGQCHSSQAWKPATFDHSKFFVLDGDHNATCVTCHVGNDYSRYTCYGCHEHRPDKVLAEHREEGIGNLDNCAKCHRSAEGEAGD